MDSEDTRQRERPKATSRSLDLSVGFWAGAGKTKKTREKSWEQGYQNFASRITILQLGPVQRRK